VSLELKIINNIGGFSLNVGWTIDNELLVRFPLFALKKSILFGTGSLPAGKRRKSRK